MSTIYFYLAWKHKSIVIVCARFFSFLPSYPVGNVLPMKIQPRRILLLLQSCWRKPLRTIHVRYITLCLSVN